MLKEPPHLQADVLLDWTERRRPRWGRIFPQDLWGWVIPAGLRRRKREFFHFPHIQAEPNDGKERKSGVAGRSGKINERKRAGQQCLGRNIKSLAPSLGTVWSAAPVPAP